MLRATAKMSVLRGGGIKVESFVFVKQNRALF